MTTSDLTRDEFNTRLASLGTDLRKFQHSDQWYAFLDQHSGDQHELHGDVKEGAALWRAWCERCRIGAQWARDADHLRWDHEHMQKRAEAPARIKDATAQIAKITAAMKKEARLERRTRAQALKILEPFLPTAAADIDAADRVSDAVWTCLQTTMGTTRSMRETELFLRQVGLPQSLLFAKSFQAKAQAGKRNSNATRASPPDARRRASRRRDRTIRRDDQLPTANRALATGPRACAKRSCRTRRSTHDPTRRPRANTALTRREKTVHNWQGERPTPARRTRHPAQKR